MTELKSFPKIWHLGHKCIKGIFEQDVEITEKVDGSQFVFGWDKDGKYHCRSKGVRIEPDEAPNLFFPVVEWSRGLKPLQGHVFYGETLSKPKHNTLVYDRTPTNHFALFGVSDIEGFKHVHNHALLTEYSEILGCDVVPLLHKGKANFELVDSLLHKESFLGGPNAEGVVVKADVQYELYGQHTPLMCGKFVTEAFKEVHQKNPEFHSGKGKVQDLFESYRTQARWEKAVQFLRDSGQLDESPKDISSLMKRVNTDVEEECKEEVMEKLWSIYRKDFLKNVTVGLPEWYKRSLASDE